MTALSILIALQLSLLIVRFLYQRLCFKGLDVRLFFSAPTAVEGDSMTLSTALTNAKWLPLPWVAVKFQVSKFLHFTDFQNSQITDDYYRNDLYNLLMYQRITRKLEFICTKRGYYRFKSLDITGWDLLMTRKYVNNFKCDADLTVFPAKMEVPETEELYSAINGHIRAQRFIHPDPFTFRGIREYAPNDPIKAINFKASAKTSDLMVNLWDYSLSRQVILMLNLQRQSHWHNELLDERAIKVTASLAERLSEANIPIRFITNGTGILTGKGTNLPEGAGTKHLNQILEALAHINLELPPQDPFHETLTKTHNQHQQEPEYWLISSYHEPDLEQAYQNLSSKGAKTTWILPHSQRVEVNNNFHKRNKIILVQ